jgi:hypothetical protein
LVADEGEYQKVGRSFRRGWILKGRWQGGFLGSV